MTTYGVGDLKHGARCCCLVSTHDVLELYITAILLFGTEDWTADYRGVLVIREVLRRSSLALRVEGASMRLHRGRTDLSCITGLEEAGTAVEDWIQCQQSSRGRRRRHIPMGTSAMLSGAQEETGRCESERGQASG